MRGLLHKNQRGFSGVELTIVVLVVALIGVVGYGAYSRQHKANDTTATTTTSSVPKTTATVSAAPAISSTTDLDKAAAVLDKNDPATTNASDTTQLDSQVNAL